jgi:nucleoside-diphosphate-sugar epimerase
LYGVEIVIPRILTAYGPGQPATKLIPYVANRLRSGETVEVASAERLVDWVYVEDAVAGILAVASAPAVHDVIDVGSGTLTSIGSTVEQLIRIVQPSGHAEVRYIGSRSEEGFA